MSATVAGYGSSPCVNVELVGGIIIIIIGLVGGGSLQFGVITNII